MSRNMFMTIAAAVGAAVALLCVVSPAALLATKGLTSDHVAEVWVREVGVLLLALSLSAFLARSHPDSPTMRVLLVGLAVAQFGLFPIEIWAWSAGVIPTWSGIIGNSIVHVLLGSGLAWFASRIPVSQQSHVEDASHK